MRVDAGPRRSNSTSTLLPDFLALSISFPPRVSMDAIDMPICVAVVTTAGFTFAMGALKVREAPEDPPKGRCPSSDEQPAMNSNATSREADFIGAL